LIVLQSRSIIHRDIAARNFLVSNGLNVKLSDFGLARKLREKSEYDGKSASSLPIRWAAPEVLMRHQFSIQSDRYSLGVLIWEIFSKGGVPWVYLNNQVSHILNKN